MRKIIFLAIYLGGILFYLSPTDFKELIDLALKNDAQLKQLKLSLNNALLEEKRSKLKQGTSITIGNSSSPAISLSYSYPGNSYRISTTPFISLNLGDPYYTNISLASTLTSTLSPQGPQVSITPTLSIQQPLNTILGLTESTILTDTQSLYNVEKAKIAIQERVIEIKEEIASQIKIILQTEEELGKDNYLLETKENQLTKMEKLGSYSRESYEYLALRNDIKNLKRSIAYQKRKLHILKRKLEYSVGQKIDKVPGPPPENKLPSGYMQPIEKINLNTNPDYRLASLEKNIANLKLENQTENPLPEYSVGISYFQATSNTQQQGTNFLRESFSFKLEDLLVQANISQELFTGGIDGEVLLSWTYNFDKEEEEIETEELTNNLKIAELKLARVRKKIEQTVTDINLSLQELINEKKTIEDNIKLAKKHLDQLKLQFDRGLISIDQVNSATWNLKELEIQAKLNILNIYLLGLKREELFME